jgi:serine/threonine-protein kinase
MQAINPAISESLKRIILKATDKSSVMRYQDVEEMVADLRRAMTDDSGDFVSERAAVDSHTVEISQEVRQEINRLNRGRRELPDEETDEYEAEYDYEYDDDYFYENEPPNKKTELKVILAAISTALVLVALITAGAYYIYQKQKPVAFNPPDVTGLTMEAARKLADEEYGLKILEMEAIYSDDTDAGIIMDQAEKITDLVYTGDVLHVTVSLGTDKILLPRVELYTAERARETLTELGFRVEEQPYEDENLKAGLVIKQEPPANTPLLSGDTVVIHVSAGPDTSMVVVPSLYGRKETEAQEILRNARLTPGVSSKAESTTYIAGDICKQSVEPGETVEPGTVVDYTLSTGAPIPTPTPATPTPAPTQEPITGPITDPFPPAPVETPPPEPLSHTGTLTINPWWDTPPASGVVHLIVREIAGNNPAAVLYNDPNVLAGWFPLTIAIEGSGEVEYLISTVDEDGTEVFKFRHTHLFDD